MKARYFFAIIILSVASITVGNAQPVDPGGDPDVPITGIEILIGAGGALGLKKLNC
jgi:hypothetical protein